VKHKTDFREKSCKNAMYCPSCHFLLFLRGLRGLGTKKFFSLRNARAIDISVLKYKTWKC